MPSGPSASPASEMPEAEGFHPLQSESPTAGLNDRWVVSGVCIFLAVITFAVFGQTLRHEFVNFDDDLYVYENPTVTRGLNLKGVEWAFTHSVCANWHPLTIMSHMLDCQFYGLNAGGHHLTNVFLHIVTAILLFLVLRRMTGFLWRSAFVAAVFAIHPLRVESVAWVAERKDVLSGLFFMLTIGAYVRYARRPWSPARYGLVVLFFALGLMCKPMLVTVPLVLLVLDYWPLNRWQASVTTEPGFRLAGWRFPKRLVFEKLPLLGLAIASCVVTLYAQKNAILSFQQTPLCWRLGNALISYVAYLGQMFWPSDLAVIYPLTAGAIGPSNVVLSLFFLTGISVGAFVFRRRCPYFLAGWVWYLIMLLPVIGIVQVGIQARADRYTYLPQIGLYLLLTWAAAELCASWRDRRVVLGGGATVILVALIFCARVQTAYWQNSISLWNHTLACTSDNFIGYGNLGNALLRMGSVDEAIAQFQKALQINPDFGDAYSNLGNALFQRGQTDEAITCCQKALVIMPNSPEAHGNLGNALFQKGRVGEAIAEYQKVLKIKPDSAKAHNNLGSALIQAGDLDGAIAYYQKAMQIEPIFAEARNNFNNAQLLKERVAAAVSSCQKALRISPDSPEALNNLAWLLATCPDARVRDGVQAVKYGRRACELTHYGVTLLVGTLAAAYAEAGRYDDAIATAEKACALAAAAGEQDLLGRNQKLLALYRTHQPYHETAEKVVPAAP